MLKGAYLTLLMGPVVPVPVPALAVPAIHLRSEPTGAAAARPERPAAQQSPAGLGRRRDLARLAF